MTSPGATAGSAWITAGCATTSSQPSTGFSRPDGGVRKRIAEPRTGSRALRSIGRSRTSSAPSEGLSHPGRVHYVYIGADRSSFHSGFTMADQDRIEIDFTTHGVRLTHRVDWR
nr:hypothetical protein [Streptomyces sp. Tue6028]